MEGAGASGEGPAPFSLELGTERRLEGDTVCLSHFPRGEQGGSAGGPGLGGGVRRGRKGQDCDRGRGGGQPLTIWLGQGQVLQLLEPPGASSRQDHGGQ